MVVATLVPRTASHKLRERIKDLFRNVTFGKSLADRLQNLNPLLKGWSNFYCHAWGAKRVFASLDHYVWWTILRWLRKKHRHVSLATLVRRYGKRGRAAACIGGMEKSSRSTWLGGAYSPSSWVG